MVFGYSQSMIINDYSVKYILCLCEYYVYYTFKWCKYTKKNSKIRMVSDKNKKEEILFVLSLIYRNFA